MKLPKLTRKIAEFQSSVSNLKVIKNTDPFLRQLSEEKGFDERVKSSKDIFDVIGEGSARIVFKLPDDKVLKLAINGKGLAQNVFEARPELQAECCNKVLMADPDGKWLIVRFAEKLTEKKFEKLVGISFDKFNDALYYKFNNESDSKRPKEYDEIVKNPVFHCLVELMMGAEDLQLGDLMKINSWGEVDGRPVVIDIGLSKEIYNSLY